MDPIKALETVKAALNAATEKGVFGDLKTAFVLFQCLQTIEQALNYQDGSDTNINGPGE
jgi:hypothetical protein